MTDPNLASSGTTFQVTSGITTSGITKMPTIPDALNTLQTECEHMHEIVSKVEATLEGLLRPLDVDHGTALGSVPGPTSGIRARIDDATSSVLNARERLHTLLQRIDL